MERLTLDEAIAHAKEVAEEKYNEGFLCHANTDDGKMDECVKCAQEHEQLAELLTQLKEYQQLEEQGRLIKLPCKVGDTVYVPTRDFISELRIAHIAISKNNTFFHWMLNAGIYPNLDGFSVDKIGKTVFLTKSEAEAKLKELRGGSIENG